jgi:hypothetical protein
VEIVEFKEDAPKPAEFTALELQQPTALHYGKSVPPRLVSRAVCQIQQQKAEQPNWWPCAAPTAWVSSSEIKNITALGNIGKVPRAVPCSPLLATQITAMRGRTDCPARCTFENFGVPGFEAFYFVSTCSWWWLQSVVSCGTRYFTRLLENWSVTCA